MERSLREMGPYIKYKENGENLSSELERLDWLFLINFSINVLMWKFKFDMCSIQLFKWLLSYKLDLS